MQIPKSIADRLRYSTRKCEDENTVYPSDVTLTHEPKACDDCERTVTDRRTALKLYQHPHKHWRTVCLNCKRVKHPQTGEFSLTDKASIVVFRHLAASKR